MAGTVRSLDSAEQLGRELEAARSANQPLAVAYFFADWHPPCAQMTQVVAQLAADYSQVRFLQVDAEQVDQLSELHAIVSVPTFLFFSTEQSRVVDRLEGAHPPQLLQKINAIAGGATGASSATAANQQEVTAQSLSVGHSTADLHKLTNARRIMLFMKGSPQEPRCGFSQKASALLRQYTSDFGYFDILSDDAVRQGLKQLSNWPTFPQVYVGGKLLGGLDILQELHSEGELANELGISDSQSSAPSLNAATTPMPATSTPSGAAALGTPSSAPVAVTSDAGGPLDLDTKLRRLVAAHKVMLFMKGVPDAPQCGFSSKIVQILQTTGAPFGYFNILADDQVRQGLKQFSNWPTFPQLYVDGKLVGGLDIVQELQQEGELAATLGLA